MTQVSGHDTAIHLLLSRLVTAATEGALRRGSQNHGIALEFMEENLRHPGALMPTVSGTTRTMTGFVLLFVCDTCVWLCVDVVDVCLHV